MKEVELFKAVDCWATNECEKQGLAAKSSVKRKILGEQIVKVIRFPIMAQKQFADVVLDSDILTKKESFDLMKYFNSVLKFPVGFSEASRIGSQQRRSISRFESLVKSKGVWSYNYPDSGNCRDSIVVSIDKNIKLLAVRLFGSEHNKYSVTLKVTDSNGVVLATKKGNFVSELIQSEAGDYQGFEIVFEPPVALQEALLGGVLMSPV